MKNILLLTTMYPDPLRPVSTGICHSFALEWKKMGYNVLVVHYRSMFPAIYTTLAGWFPKLAYRYVGNYVEMDREQNIVEYDQDGIHVYSIPVYKYIPHGKYTRSEILKQNKKLLEILNKRSFTPDAIIGHFFNPQMEIVSDLKKEFPNAKTCVSLHELDLSVLKKVYGNKLSKILEGIDVMGFRSVPIKQRYEKLYGDKHKSLVCWSGTPQNYLDIPQNQNRKFDDGAVRNFIFVGQTIKRKYPKETIEAIHRVYGDERFHLTYVGSMDTAYEETIQYIEQNKLSEKVLFAGQIKRDEIIKHYDGSDCFIMISKNEVFGLVYLEAMSRGCIVIAAKDEGMEGIIEQGVNGFLCEAGNTEELANIIRTINNLTAAEKELISKNARKTAEDLSDHSVAKMYIDNVMNS